MINNLYFRFYRFTHSRILSICLSKITYTLLLIFFWVKKSIIKNNTDIKMSEADAEYELKKVYEDPSGRPEYNKVYLNSQIDLSIIVPVYNYANLIRNNIDSILNQKTKYKYELILVDDGSTDGAREIVLSYSKDPKVKVILQENKRIAGARNTGLDKASGKYIMFVDCDDIVHDDIVEILLNKAYETSCDIVMCAHNLVKEKDGEVYQVIPNIYPGCDLQNYKGKASILNYAGLPWCKVYKRELWENVRFFPNYWYEDTIIQFLLFTQANTFEYVPRVEYEYKWYEKNYSHTQNNVLNPKSLDSYWLVKAILEQYDNLGLPHDDMLYILLLKHMSLYLYPKIQGLGSKLVEAAFVLAIELVKKYKPKETVKMPYVLKCTERAFLEKNIELWKLCCRYL